MKHKGSMMNGETSGLLQEIVKVRGHPLVMNSSWDIHVPSGNVKIAIENGHFLMGKLTINSHFQ